MDDKLYTVAGRSMFLDGGIRFLILDAASGEKLGEQIMDDKVPGTDEELQMQHEILNMPVALSDVLSTNGKKIFMRYQEFDLEGNRLNIGHDRKLYGATKDEVDVANQPAMEQQKGEDAHVFSGTGFLDDTWWHRTYWIFGKINASGWLGHTRAGAAGTPAGRIMSFNEDNIFVWGRMQKYFKWTTKYEYLLRSQDHDFEQQWGVAVPILVRSMVLAGDEIYLLGPEEVTRQEPAFKTITAADTQEQMAEQEQALLGNSGSTLLRIDAKNGTILGGITLDSAPQFDGLAAAYDKLYVTMMDGTLRCFGESGGPLDTVTPGQVAEWNKAGVIPAKDKKKA